MYMKKCIAFVVFTCTLMFGCSSQISSLAPSTEHKTYTIEQFLSTKNYSGGTFSYNEQNILFSSDESGIMNVYSMDLATGMTKQRTNSHDKAMSIIADLPSGKGFLFASDGHGDERYHLYVSDAEGIVRDLTPDPSSRSVFHGFSYDQKSFFFLSNKRDARFMDLYEMDLDTFTPRLLFQNDQAFEIGDVSSDKRLLSLTKVITNNDQDLYLFDFANGQLTNLTPAPGDISNAACCFSVDSKKLYYFTDEESDFTYVKSYTMADCSFETVIQEPWDIVFFGFSHDGRYSVSVTNEEGAPHVKVSDLLSHQALLLPKLSDGEVLAVLISRSSHKMLMKIGGDRTPSNYFLYDMQEKSCRKLTRSLPEEINSSDLVDSQVVRYPSYDGVMIPALYYRPHLCDKKVKVPALIWVHGGPGGQSTKGYNGFIQFLVNQGYAILAVNNRGSSGYGKTFFKAADRKHGEADLDDCIWAKKYLISTGEIDEHKIGIIGGSYGGYMTLAALTFRPQEMALGIDLFGVSNWLRTLTSLPAWWESERELLYQKIGNPRTDTDYLKTISPLFHAQSIQKPLLVIQGANDPRVLQAESDEIVEEVRKNKVPCEYLLYPDEGHGFSKKENKQSAFKAVLHFLETYLR